MRHKSKIMDKENSHVKKKILLKSKSQRALLFLCSRAVFLKIFGNLFSTEATVCH